MPRGVPAEISEYERRAISLAVEMGWPIRAIARFLSRDRMVIARHLKRQSPWPENPEDCEIVTPLHLTPSSPPTVIHAGDAAYCVVSDLTGIEGHPKLIRPRKRPKAKKSPAKFVPRGAKSA